jgi:hypothetical protein
VCKSDRRVEPRLSGIYKAVQSTDILSCRIYRNTAQRYNLYSKHSAVSHAICFTIEATGILVSLQNCQISHIGCCDVTAARLKWQQVYRSNTASLSHTVCYASVVCKGINRCMRVLAARLTSSALVSYTAIHYSLMCMSSSRGAAQTSYARLIAAKC